VDPYYTPDGVSRGFSVYAQKQDGFLNVSSFSTTSYGAAVNFAYPISEIQQIGFNFGFGHTELSAYGTSAQEIQRSPVLLDGVDRYIISEANLNPWEGPVTNGVTRPLSDMPLQYQLQTGELGFIDKYGREFDNFTFSTNWVRSTLNRGQLATRGSFQQAQFEFSVPGSDLEYYRLTYNADYYKPIFGDDWVFHLRGNLGYGDGYGDTEELPFFQNFFAGGLAYNGVVRGFEENSLGPQSTPPQVLQSDFATLQTDENGNVLVDEAGRPTGYDGNRAYLTVPVFDANGDPVLDENGDQQLQLATTTYQFDRDRDNFGGNFLTAGSAEILFPLPFVKDRSRVRSSFFFDVGSVFSTDCSVRRQQFNNCSDFDVGELRYSVGVGVTYLSPFGPLTFYLAKPFTQGEEDDTKTFDFTIGAGF
jgi:outer membrane protein insertion porin family